MDNIGDNIRALVANAERDGLVLSPGQKDGLMRLAEKNTRWPGYRTRAEKAHANGRFAPSGKL